VAKAGTAAAGKGISKSPIVCEVADREAAFLLAPAQAATDDRSVLTSFVQPKTPDLALAFVLAFGLGREPW
jgi:hypothetical protein